MAMHRLMAETLDAVIEEIKEIQINARENNDSTRPKWPMITFSAHQRDGPDRRLWTATRSRVLSVPIRFP